MTGSVPAKGRRKPGGTYSLVCLVAVGTLAALSAVLTFVLPRPYFILSNDYDNGHYYNVRALYQGLPIHNVEHPGTLVFLLGRLVMTRATAHPENVKTFLAEMYVVVGAVTCASLAVFCRLVLRPLPVPAAALALASLVAWPGFLVHLNTFCTESFVLAAGLMALAGLWIVLEAFPRPSLRDVVFSGATAGLALSVKLSFVPFVGALMCAVVFSVLRAEAPPSTKVRNALSFVFSLTASFVVAILPVAHRLDEIILGTFDRADVNPGGSVSRALASAFSSLLKEQPAFVALLGASVLLMFAVAVSALARRSGESAGAEVGFDILASLGFFVLVAGAFLYSLVCAAPDMKFYDSVGHSLRNASPSALVVPFAVLCFFRLVVPGIQEGWKPAWVLRHGVVLAAVVLAVTSVSWYLVRRQKLVQERSRIVAETKARFDELRRTSGTIAFWDGSPGWRLGEASFHFWGDYRYTESFFRGELEREFPGMTWLHLRDIRHLYREGRGTRSAPRVRRRSWWRVPLHEALQYWLAFKGRFPVFPRAQTRLFAGERNGFMPDLLAFPEREAREEVYDRIGLSRSELHAWLEGRMGPLDLWTERIADTEWVFLARAGGDKKPARLPAESPGEARAPEGKP